MNQKIYILQAAPGVGKSTLINILKKNFPRGYFIEADLIRSCIGKVNWDKHDRDYYLTLEILASMINVLIKREDYNPIFIIDCIVEEEIIYLFGFLDKQLELKQLIIWADNRELAKRINLRSDNQFKNLNLSRQMNDFFRQKYQKSSNEKIIFIDTTNINPGKNAKKITQMIRQDLLKQKVCSL